VKDIMRTEKTYSLPGGVTVTRTQPACGAVVSGVDLAALGDEQMDGIKRALFAHGVVFLTGQGHMTFEDHLAFAENFGTPVCDGPDPERPQITPVSSKAGSREGTASHWHIDGCYQQQPTSVSILRAISPSPFGGDTCFSSTTAAYAGLPDELKAEIDGLKYYSCLADRMPKDHGGFGTADKWNKLREQYPPVEQPVVICHPVTGARALYANSSWTIRILDKTPEESEALLARLLAEIPRPEYQTRWQWQEGAVAIWDNRLVQHYGVPDQTTDRYMERIAVHNGKMLSIADWDAKRSVAA
jgi:taurine dioxygenase